jgi:hypothetical protein
MIQSPPPPAERFGFEAFGWNSMRQWIVAQCSWTAARSGLRTWGSRRRKAWWRVGGQGPADHARSIERRSGFDGLRNVGFAGNNRSSTDFFFRSSTTARSDHTASVETNPRNMRMTRYVPVRCYGHQNIYNANKKYTVKFV